MTIISDALRQGLRSTSKPLIEIERMTGVSADSIQRFLRGEQSLRLDAADKLAAFLGVEVMNTTTAEAPEVANVLQAIAQGVNTARPELNCPVAKGHFFTVPVKIEDSVKIEVLRRAQSGGTAVLIGLAFNSSDRDRNHRQAERYLHFLESESPPFEIHHLPPPKSNVYLTALVPVPVGRDIEEFIRRCVGIVLWFVDRPYNAIA